MGRFYFVQGGLVMPKSWKTSDGRIMFYCQGCDCHHAVTNSWSFNGDYGNPTFSPSILVRGTKMTEKGEAEYKEYLSSGIVPESKRFDSVPTVCHSFVMDGKIQYLSDCTHELAGQTVEIEDLETE